MAVISTPQDLKTIVMELLREFKIATNGKKPEKIIFYRDGVSEGQFETVQRLEIPQARRAFSGALLHTVLQTLNLPASVCAATALHAGDSLGQLALAFCATASEVCDLLGFNGKSIRRGPE